MQFVWSDDLARLLAEEDDGDRAELLGWETAIIGYRLPEGVTPLQFARRLRNEQREASADRRAS